MPRQRISTETLIGAVRRHFGLSQQELSMILDVSKALIGHIEAGRRDLTSALHVRLFPLARHLPAPPLLPPDTEPLPATAPAPEAAPLEFRRKLCLHRAAGLRLELGKLTARAVYASRWQQALPTILADLEAAAALLPPVPEEQDLGASIRRWLPSFARRFKPSHAAQYHLLRLQAEAYETEAAALAELLARV
ncbi:helix-turn-helix domain-containing protein [Hymenobacter ruricola]|uniref:Helix-turn-helix transcriptional regulator n=1 Tax=Hymenobacter ruricola TaxID=2791023 RepID=A0ABS0I559_9BACT|nr:helix-turn-helix transcriptional regulator [Hymenobacter ruricola]MBF9222083.1 helix-turn-helix transcriptional regulator [Hymenobacter ruricola]